MDIMTAIHKTIRNLVSLGLMSVAFSAYAGGNVAPTASTVVTADINGGGVVVGDTLAGSYAYDDKEMDDEGISTFRWLRNGTAINGAISSIYTLQTADSGETIAFEVTPIALTGKKTGVAVVSKVDLSHIYLTTAVELAGLDQAYLTN